MACSCIRGKYNFHVEAYREAIVYQDFSEWMTAEPYVIPQGYTIEVQPPERTKTTRLFIELNDTIKASEIELSSIEDGIYTFTVVDCGSNKYIGCCEILYNKSVLLTPHIDCCILNAYATLDRDGEVQEIESILNQAKNAIELGKIKEAQLLFKAVKRKIKTIECNC